MTFATYCSNTKSTIDLLSSWVFIQVLASKCLETAWLLSAAYVAPDTSMLAFQQDSSYIPFRAMSMSCQPACTGYQLPSQVAIGLELPSIASVADPMIGGIVAQQKEAEVLHKSLQTCCWRQTQNVGAKWAITKGYCGCPIRKKGKLSQNGCQW